MQYAQVISKRCWEKCEKATSTKRFPFHPHISYLNVDAHKAVKNQLFIYASYRAEFWWVGRWDQVDTNDLPFSSSGPMAGKGGVEGEVALAPPIIHLMLYVSQAQMGLLSKNLVGRAVPQEY